MKASHQSIASRSPAAANRGAFSLIELLVVLVIIVMIIAIVVPSLGSARDLAKRSATEQMAARLSQAMMQFQTDKRRLPGVFSPRDMGAAENANTRGMSAMENVMLDLMDVKFWSNPADVPPPPAGPDPMTELAETGPITAKRIFVDLRSLGVSGSSKNVYFTPDTKHYALQVNRGASEVAQFGNQSLIDPVTMEPRAQLPDLLDAFGTPFLLWMEDDTATGRIDPAATPTSGTCRFVTDSVGTSPAKFYWASNAAFLKANRLGQKRIDMTDLAKTMIGGLVPAADQLNTLAAMLGNPSFASTNPSATPTRDILPSAGRGKYIIHSAGINRTFAGTKEKIAGQGEVAGVSRRIFYGMNFRSLAQNPPETHLDSNGKPTTEDNLKYMDDILVGGGN